MSEEEGLWSSSVKAILASIPFSYENETLPPGSIVISLLTQKDLLQVIKVLIENESDFLSHEEEYELFYSSYAALSTYHLCAGVSNLQKSSLNDLEKACKVLLQFFLNRLQKKYENCPIAKKQLIILIKSLCRGASLLPKSDITVFTTQLKFAKVPQKANPVSPDASSSSGSPQKPSKMASLEKSTAYEHMLSIFCDVASSIQTFTTSISGTPSTAGVAVQSTRSKGKRSHQDNLGQQSSGTIDGCTLNSAFASISTPPTLSGSRKVISEGEATMEMQEIMASRNLATLQRHLKGNDVLLEVCASLQSLKKFESGGFCGNLVWPTGVGEALPVVARLQQVAADVSIVWRIFSLPIFEPLTKTRLKTIVSIATSCLNAAISVTLATGIVSMSTGTPIKGTTGVKDEEMDGHAASVVQKSLDIFNWLSQALQKSSKASGAVLQNYHLMGAWSLLKGLQSLLFLNLTISTEKVKEGAHKTGKSLGDMSGSATATKGTKEPKEIKEPKDAKDLSSQSSLQNKSSSKMQITFGPLYVALANQALRLLISLIKDLELENLASVMEVEQEEIGDEVKLFEEYTALQRMRKLMKAIYLSNLFHFLISQFFKKGLTCSKSSHSQRADKTSSGATAATTTATEASVAASGEDKVDGTDQEHGSVDAESESSDSNTFYEEDFSSSQEDISYDEEDSEPILGQWFEETLSLQDALSDSHDHSYTPNPEEGVAGSVKSSKHPRRHSNTESTVLVPDRKEPEAYAKLATDILNFTIQHFIESSCSELVQYFGSTLTEDHVNQMANLVKELDSEFGPSPPSHLFEGFSKSLACYIHLLINKGLLSDALQMNFLEQLGLNISSKQPDSPSVASGDSWPLQVQPRALSVLAEVFLRKQQGDLSTGINSGDVASGSLTSGTPRKVLSWSVMVINAWHKFLRSLTNAITSQPNISDSGEFVDFEDVNAEHIQLLLFFFHNLTLMEKKALWIHLCSCVVKVHHSIKDRMDNINPLLVGRLILIVDYLLHCFYEAHPILSEKVASGLFRVFTGTLKDVSSSSFLEKSSEADESSDERYLFESDMESASKVNGEESSTSSDAHKKSSSSLFQMRPKFYKLRFSDGSSPDPPKVDGLACSFLLGKNDSLDYDEFYDCVLSLLSCGSLTTRFGNRDIKDSMKWAACRKYHLLTTWKLLSSLPLSVSYLRQMDADAPEFSSELTYLHASRWIPRINNHSHQVWTKDFLVKQGLTMQAAEVLMSDVIKKASRFSTKIDSIGRIFCNENFLESLSQFDVFRLCLVDLMATGLCADLDPDLQVQSKQWIELTDTFDNEDFNRLLESVLGLLRKIFKASKDFLVKMTHEDVKSTSPIKLEAALSYEKMLLIGFAKNGILNEHFSATVSSLYPPSVKNAIDKWNEPASLVFPSEFTWKNGGDSVESHLDKLQRAHLHFLSAYPTATNVSQILRPSLKNALFTLTSLFMRLLELVNPVEIEEMSQLTVELSCHAVAGFMPDLVRQLMDKMEHVYDNSNMIDKSRRATTAYLVEVCHKVIFLHNTSGLGASEEKRAMECLACLESVAEKPLGKKVLEEYYQSNPEHLFELLMLVSKVSPSCGYQSKIFKYINKLLQIASNPSDQGIREVMSNTIRQMSDCTVMRLTEWLTPIIVPNAEQSNNCLSSEPQHAGLKSLFWSFVASIRDAKMMEELGPTLLCVMAGISHDVLPPKGDSSLFPEMFNVMMSISSVLEAPHGPQTLFTSAATWINSLIAYLNDHSTNGLLENDLSSKQQQCIMESMCCIFQYVRDVCMSRKQSEGSLSPLPVDGVGGANYFFHPSIPEYESDANEDNAEEDDSNDDESDEESLANKLCTYTITQKEFMNQHWYHCHTCKMVDGVGVCTVCAKVCHKDHDISYSKYGSFFCDCGAREDDSKCLALKKRTVAKDHKTRQQQHKHQHRKQRYEAKREEMPCKQLFSPLFWSDNLNPASESKSIQTPGKVEDDTKKQQVQEIYFKILSEKKTIDNLVNFFDQIQPAVSDFYEKLSPGGFLAKSQKAISELHQLPKAIEMSDSLMVSTIGAQEGTLENIKTTFTGDQGQTIRQLITSHVLKRVGATCLASPFSRRQFLAVSCEKGKVIILQLSTLLKQVGAMPASGGKKKVVVSKHAAAQVPFTVLNIVGCPSNEDLLAVCGLKDCHILTFTSSGSLSDHLVLHLALESGNFIIKAVWLPGSQSEIAVVTADFVKVYNLVQDAISPQYFFLLPAGKIRDVTFICGEAPKDLNHIVIMASTGYIYIQVLDDTSSARTGVFFITNVFNIIHPDLNESNGQVAGGGSSVYYSHGLQMLFFSYAQGKNFAASLEKDLECIKMMFQISIKASNGSNSGNNNSKTSSAGQQTLIQWSEVFDHPGLICCSVQSTNNPVMLFIKPEKILVQEIKFPPSKNKLQDFVLVRHFSSASTTSNSAGTPVSDASTPSTSKSGALEKRTSLVLIFDDGSLKILTTDLRATDYWMMTHFVCSEPSPPPPPPPPPPPQTQTLSSQSIPSSKSLPPSKTKKKLAATHVSGRASGQVTFLVDFFEHCQVLNEVEFGGNDVLQFYHTAQLKNRLNTTGMYVACNKPGGFSIEVTNPTHNNVMVGVRVLVGIQSIDRAPSSIEIFGRIIPISLTRNRWYDIPFTRDESLGADKNFTITFGPSRDPNHITIVDSVKVYVKNKGTFGWPYDSEELEGKTPLARNLAGTDGDLSSPMVNSSIMLSSNWATPGPLDKLLVKSMELLEDCFSNCKTFSEQKNLKKLAQNVATNILVLPVSGVVQQKIRSLLSSLFASKASFYWHVDQTYLSMMIKCLDNFEETSTLQFDIFQKLIPIIASLATSRPSNFGRFYNAWKQHQSPLQDLNQPQSTSESKGYMKLTATESQHLASRLSSAFWHLVSLQVDNPIILPVYASGVSNISSTVSSLVVILHSFILLDGPDVMPLITKLLVRMLLSENQQVNYPCKHALIKIYKPPVPARSTRGQTGLTVVQVGSNNESESGQRSAMDEFDKSQPSSMNEEAQDNESQQQAASAGSRSSAPDVLESEIEESGNIQALLDADDEAMVQLAIALSLQDQPGGSSGGVAGDILGAQLQAAASHHLSDVTASNQASDDEVGSTAATEGSALQISPAEPRISAAASESSGSNAGSVSVSGRSSATAEIVGGEITSGSGQLDVGQGTPGGSVAPGSTDEEERREPDEEDGEAKWHSHCMKMLKLLVGYLHELRNTSGNGAVPYLQFLIVLVFEIDPSVDSANLDYFLTNIIDELDISLPDQDSNPPSQLLARSPRWEVRLLLLRMLSVFMSRSRVPSTTSTGAAGTSAEKSSSAGSLGSENPGLSSVVAYQLKKKKVLEFCLRYLQFLLASNFLSAPLSSQPKDAQEAGPKIGQLLKPRQLSPPPDLSPFFLKQYTKSHAMDVFEDFHQLLVEILLRIPYQVKKLCDSLKFNADWHFVLAEYMITNQVPFVKKQVRKLLLYVCGSKERYRLERDLHFLEKHMSTIRELCSCRETTNIPYDMLINVIDHLKSCLDVANTRTLNWQKFCQKSKGLLPFLIQSSVTLDEGVAPLLLQLLQYVLCGDIKASSDGHHQSTTPSKGSSVVKASSKKEKRMSENSDSESVLQQHDEGLCTLLTQQICSSIGRDLLTRFIVCFLLESNQTSVRWQAHSLVLNIFRNSLPDQKENIIDLMWNIWPDLHVYGSKAAQFVDLLGYFTIKANHISESKLKSYVERALLLMRTENKILANHPNGTIYNTLEGLVDFDGYYLERDPCLVCNNPEVPFTTMKLSTVKSDSKFTTSCQIVKLNASHTISKFVLRITDIKRSKMVKTLVVYYNNKQVQAILELKNKPALWHKAKKVTLNPGQSEVKVEFSLPIVACNLMIEFADFYDNVQASAETLQCPRCSASVPANPGVCNNCGENVFQCHKCRAINYDEKDPFLCNSCGFCKYAKFDFTMVARQCCAVDPIENEEDRKKAVASINSLLESADGLYKMLHALKTTLDGLLLKVTDHHTSSFLGFFDPKDDPPPPTSAPPSGSTPAGSGAVVTNAQTSMASSGSINRFLHQLALKYCGECKNSFDELSKIIQKVLATRKELVEYDRQQQEIAMLTSSSATLTSSSLEVSQSTSGIVNAALTSSTLVSSSQAMRPSQDFKAKENRRVHCYGCSSSSVEHCITLLRAMSTNNILKDYLCGQGLIRELFDYNLRRGSAAMRSEVRQLLCLMSTNHVQATEELLSLLHDNVAMAIKGHFSNPDFASAVRHEMCLLGGLLQIEDNLWEQRLRCVMRLFVASVKYDSPSIQDCISLPCLRIFQRLIRPLVASPPHATSSSSKNKRDKSNTEILQVLQPPVNLTANLRDWMNGDPSASFNAWKAALPSKSSIPESAGGSTSKKRSKEDKLGSNKDGEKLSVRAKMLSEKYFNRWHYNTKMSNKKSTSLKMIDRTWMKKAMFSPASAAMRQTECQIVESICKVPGRKQDVIDMLSSCLEEVGTSGEASAEFLSLYKKLISGGHWKYYAALRGVLFKITSLITMEINEYQRLEGISLTSDLSQGFALKSLTDLLSTFLEVDSIKQHYKNRLVGSILDGYLSLRKLVVQRTKMIDETQEKMLELLEEMTTGNEHETKEFMAVCVETVNKYPLNDFISPVFIFERLCNIIHPEAGDSREFLMSLEKEPQQEDFLQGRMMGNPYSSNEPGLGPLMRDVKNKICQDCELVALLEDDTGMELLVSNKIISLDLPVKDVYRKIWLQEHSDSEAMRIVYRMRGLLGDATEDMVNSLETGKDSDVDCEEVYKMAAVMSQCNGLKVMLQRLSSIHNLVTGKQLMVVLLKLFNFCLKVKANKQELIKIEMNSMTVMLGALNLALLAEQETGTSTKGQTLTEQILQIMEIILLEASSQQPPEIYKEFSKSSGDRDQLMVLLDRINSPFVRCNSSVLHSLMRLIPFLAYADEEKMAALCNHFKPYLDFNRYDFDHTQDEQVHLDCFCIIAQGIENNANGRKLKDLILERTDIVKDTVAYILGRTPSASGPPILTENEGWKEMISKPALPFALRLLTGLCKGHDPIKLQLLDVIPTLHSLEQISSDERVGSLAENLLEALKENDQVAKKIEDVRQLTKMEKKRLAMAMREKQLDQLGMMTNEKGQVTAKKSLLKGQIDVLKEETGLTCCICREGYKNQPNKVLGIYTFTKRVNLDEFENKQRKTVGYSTVTHFNIVHFDCHLAAVRHARAREEWESAALQNGNTKCNGLLPLWGPEVLESAFASCLAKHNGYLQEVTGLRDSNYLHSVHDLKHLLLRFAFEKSFSEDSGGGGRGSNMHLVPYMVHLNLYVINTTRSALREEGNIGNFLKFTSQKFLENCYEAEGPLFYSILASHIFSPQSWIASRQNFLKRILALGHARHVSPSPCNSIQDKAMKEYSVYKPYLMFYQLINLFYSDLFKGCKLEEGQPSKWSSSLADFVRNNDQSLLEASKRVLKTFEEECLPCESLQEFFDVSGLLEDIGDPNEWLREALNTLLP